MTPRVYFNKKNRLTPQNNFETFDLWNKANFVLWSNVRYDFELIAELTRHIKSTAKCLKILDVVNKYLKNTSEKVFFDGTIKSLKYLVKNKHLNISDLPSLTSDEKCLIGLLEKYSRRLDITEIFFDIEEPTLRAMLIEYPHLLETTLEDKLGEYLISKALIKNGITDYDSFVKKIDDGLNSIEVDTDKYSKEAMKCKIIYVGLWVNNKKFSIIGNRTETFKLFSTLTDQLIESENYAKGIINSIYASMYGSSEWNKEKKTHLTGCEILQLDFQLLSCPDNHMSTIIYEMILKEETERIGKKYFGENYRYEGFIASLAIKMAITIIIFRSQDFIPEGERAEIDIFGKGAMLDGLNYAVRMVEKDGGKTLELKQWFIDYYRNELDKRTAFIKLQIDNSIGLVQMRDIVRVIYLPVFESFRFFCSNTPTDILWQIIKLFKNKSIGNDIKDDILVNFVINIQKIVGRNTTDNTTISEEENYFKDTFILLIGKIFENLIKKTVRSLELQSPIKSYYEKDDLFGDANLAIIELILNFDLAKSDSFIGYLNYNIRLKIKTSSRIKKSDQYTTSEHDFEEGFLENIPDENDFIKQLGDKEEVAKMQQYIDNLPEKQKEAIRKIYEKNEQLSDTERKNKNRGLNKIRVMMGIS